MAKRGLFHNSPPLVGLLNFPALPLLPGGILIHLRKDLSFEEIKVAYVNLYSTNLEVTAKQ